jgi:hypothetical protein
MFRRSACCLLLASVLLAFASPLPARQKGDDPRVSRKTFESIYVGEPYKTVRKLYNFTETFDPKDKDHKQAVFLWSISLAYPIYWDAEESFQPGQFNKTVEGFTVDVSRMSSKQEKREKTAVLQPTLCREVIDRCAEITRKTDKMSKPSGRMIARLNAALLLSRIPEQRLERGVLRSEKDWAEEVQTRLGGGVADHLINTCLALLEEEPKRKDGINDGARYYLFRAIANALLVPAPPKKPPLVKKDVEEKAVAAAIEFVSKSPKFLKSTPREEIEGFKVLRREALKVVAASRSADLGEKGHPALVLAKFAAPDKNVTPEPRLDERTEAAMGLCRLVANAKESPGLKVDYAAWCVACATYAFAKAANPNLEDTGLKRARAWKIEALMLLEAVDKMKGEKDAYVVKAYKQCADVLGPLQKGNQAAAGDLGLWVKDAGLPPSKAISKDEKAAVDRPDE